MIKHFYACWRRFHQKNTLIWRESKHDLLHRILSTSNTWNKYTTLRVWGRTSSVPESASDISLVYLRCTQESRDNCRPCQPHGDAWGFGIQFLAPKTRHHPGESKEHLGIPIAVKWEQTCPFFVAFSLEGVTDPHPNTQRRFRSPML